MSVTSEDTISENFQNYQTEIVSSLNPIEIKLSLDAKGLLNGDPELLTNGSHTRKQKAEWVVSAVSKLAGEKGSRVYVEFLECVESDKFHTGHKYIACLLRGRKFATDSQKRESCRLKKKLEEHINRLQDLNIDELISHMYAKDILTSNDMTMFQNCSAMIQVSILWDLLKTKGPIVYKTFAECLKEEEEHTSHNDLYKLITTEEECESNNVRKRKRESLEESSILTMAKVPKRVPDRLSVISVSDSQDDKMDVIHLKDDIDYLRIIGRVRTLHLCGKWDEAEEIVHGEKVAKLSTVAQMAIKLESCTAFITLKQKDVVLERVEEVRSEIETLEVYELKGRCEWVLAKLYRYLKNPAKAKEHILNAMGQLFNVEHGEDTALVNYCYASILLEEIANEMDKSNKVMVKKCLENAIVDAQIGDYGLNLSHPYIRLAQLCLGSSPLRPGNICDPENLRQARDSLTAAGKYDFLGERTECLWCMTESDLLKNMGSKEEAIQKAIKALDIAKKHGFKTEIESVELRIKLLK